jgi:hypothetical protein
MPDAAVDNDILMAAVQLACRAPSCTTASPWQWVAEGSTCTLIAAVFCPPPTSLASLDFSPMGLVTDGHRRLRDVHTKPSELHASRHLIGNLTGRAAIPRLLIRVGECPWRGTPDDATAATTRGSDVSPHYV